MIGQSIEDGVEQNLVEILFAHIIDLFQPREWR